MDLATLAQLGEFLGGFFVVVSIVYLAHAESHRGGRRSETGSAHPLRAAAGGRTIAEPSDCDGAPQGEPLGYGRWS
jgi:hypothetical protein